MRFAGLYKRALITVGAGLLATGLCACGPDVEEITGQLLWKGFDSVTVDSFIQADADVVIDGDSYKLRADNRYLLLFDKEESFKYEEKNNVDFSGIYSDDSTKTEYFSDGYLYTDTQNGFNKLSDSRLSGVCTVDNANNIYLNIVNLLSKAEKEKKTTDLGGYDCYVFDYEISGIELYDWLALITSNMGYEKEFADFTEMAGGSRELASGFFAYTPVILKAYVTKDSTYLLAVDFELKDINFDSAMEYINYDYGMLSEALGINISDININDLYFGYNFYDYNATEVELPEELGDAAEAEATVSSNGIAGIAGLLNMENAEKTEIVEVVTDETGLPKPSDQREVELSDSDGNVVLNFSVPEDADYYDVYSGDSLINIIWKDRSKDIFISTSLADGYGSEYLSQYILGGDGADRFKESESSYTIHGGSIRYITDVYSDAVCLVSEYEDGKYIVVSFNGSSFADCTVEEICSFVADLF